MPRRVHVLALLLAAALLVVGCGGSDSKTFRQDFRPLNARIVKLGRDVGASVTGASGKSDRQIEQTFGALATRTGSLRKQVDALDPPDNLKGDRQDLVDSMGDARDALGQIASAARKSDPQAARRATIQLVAASGDLRSARLRLARAVALK
ncbi:MAG TPA: hypothetical protein VIM03_11265 [Thermoleophilaceae bacterium]